MNAQGSPASNHETGSLTQQSPHESRFVGSSTGVYFINTVKQAFEASGQQPIHGHLPAAEDTVGGDDDFAPSARNSPDRGSGYEVTVTDQGLVQVRSGFQLGSLPPFESAQQFAVAYFQTWHPVLPYLSGPEFLQELEALYEHGLQTPSRIPADRRRRCFLIIIQCVLTIGASTSPSSLQSAMNMPSPSHLLSVVAALASRHDILTIQTVLAAQLYCVSTMTLRTASSLGGLLSRLISYAGLHRCPYRYPQVSDEDRELRKRILWSAYVMDRYVCQALGIPVSLSDSEIDVCVPGRAEKHNTVPPSTEHPSSSPGYAEAGISREHILANFVEYSGLLGRALEIFHSSLHTRNKDPRKVLFLRSDVDKWFNSLPEVPKLTPQSDPIEAQLAHFLPFFHVLYEQLIISINRPALSLPRATAEFHHGLQITIRAAKRTIVAMECQSHLFWPGYLASVWMSGLILSFACQVGLYNISQGSQEILRCLTLLQRMSDRWRSAQRCHSALSTLLSDLMQPLERSSSDTPANDDTRLSKRRKLDSTPPRLSPPAVEDDIGAAQALNLSSAQASLSMQENNAYSTPMTIGNAAAWDVNDFFQDLSWNSLFDIGDMAQGSEIPSSNG